MNHFPSRKQIIEVFDKIQLLRVGVIGDFAADFYYDIQKNTGEISVETQKEVYHASQPRTSLGGAGNVVQNIASLGVKQIKAFGCVGNDVYGREMLHLLYENKVDVSAFKTLSEGWDTCTYTKPMTSNGEDNRLDFGTNNCVSDEVFDEILQAIELSLHDLDVFIINQQFPNPLLNESRILKLNNIISKFNNVVFLTDARDFGKFIRNSILKVNTAELAKMLDIEPFEESDFELSRIHALALNRKMRCPILQTRGENGILFASENDVVAVDGIKINAEIDTVGAGDTVVAAFSTAWAATNNVKTALQIANMAAAITVQKLKQTGTASLEEILRII